MSEGKSYKTFSSFNPRGNLHGNPSANAEKGSYIVWFWYKVYVSNQDTKITINPFGVGKVYFRFTKSLIVVQKNSFQLCYNYT